jgi:hypothetical protein
MQLTLLVPELIWPEPTDRDALDSLACPALNTLLARSRLLRRAAQSLEATLSDAFGLPEGTPYAPYRLLGEATGPSDQPADTCWLCADPVHLRFQQERLILADSGSFSIELDEAQAMVADLNRHFCEVGRFHVVAADRWYLQLSAASKLGALKDIDELDMPPLSAMAGRSVEKQLPDTPQAKGLRQLLNEAQMLLHAHPANEARESAGHLAINSVWLWGAGTQPAHTGSPFDGLWSSLPLAVGLGRAAGIPTNAVPANAGVLLASAAPGSRQLVVLDDLLGPVQYENGEDYRGALLALESRWFAPLQKALAAGKLKQLRIEASTAYGALCWESTRSDQWKFWRRAPPLASLAMALAKGAA